MEVRWVAGSSCRREGREEQIRGRKDIALEPADRVPARAAGVACHISKCGKNETQTSLRWYSCKCHSKSDNLMSVIRYNCKNP